jgi:hypothetical protein
VVVVTAKVTFRYRDGWTTYVLQLIIFRLKYSHRVSGWLAQTLVAHLHYVLLLVIREFADAHYLVREQTLMTGQLNHGGSWNTPER